MISDRVLHNMTPGMIFRPSVPVCNRMSKFSVHAHLLQDITSQLIDILVLKAVFSFLSAIYCIYVKNNNINNYNNHNFIYVSMVISRKSRKENPKKLTQLSSRSHPRHLVGKRTAQKDTIIDITSDSQVNSNFPHRCSPASLTFNNYFYLFLYLYIT